MTLVVRPLQHQVMEEQAPSDNSDDVEVHGLGREKDGLRLKFFIKFWNNWLNVEKKSINWNQVPVGDHWHMFAQEQEGKKWIQSEDVYNRLSDVGKMIKDILVWNSLRTRMFLTSSGPGSTLYRSTVKI